MRPFALVSALVVAVGCAWVLRPQQANPAAEPSLRGQPDADAIRVMTLNLAHGRRLAFHQAFLARETIEQNLADISSVIQRHAPHIVAAQELDGRSDWSGGFDHAAILGDLADLESVFRGRHGGGWGPLELDLGTGLLSRLPLNEPSSATFDTSWRDNKGFVVATIAPPELGGREIDIVSLHLDFLSASTRAEQLDHLATILQPRTRPLVVMGDFNCTQEDAECLPYIMERLGLHHAAIEQPTYPADHPRSQIDWILISEELEFRSYGSLPDQLSDHLAVMADVAFRPEKESGVFL